MKKVLGLVSTWFSCWVFFFIVFLYLMFSFFTLDFNPLRWDAETRNLLILFETFGFFFLWGGIASIHGEYVSIYDLPKMQKELEEKEKLEKKYKDVLKTLEIYRKIVEHSIPDEPSESEKPKKSNISKKSDIRVWDEDNYKK